MNDENEESIIRITPEECPEPTRRPSSIRIRKQEVIRISLDRWITGIRNKVFFYLKATGLGIATSILPGAIFGYVMGITGGANKLVAFLAVIIGFVNTLSVKNLMKELRWHLAALTGFISTIVGLLIGIYVCSEMIEKGFIEVVVNSDNVLKFIIICSAIVGIYLGWLFSFKGKGLLIRNTSQPYLGSVTTEDLRIDSQSESRVPPVSNINVTDTETSCPICGKLFDGSNIYPCSSCGTQHHEDCWNYNGGCGVFGCQENPSGR